MRRITTIMWSVAIQVATVQMETYPCRRVGLGTLPSRSPYSSKNRLISSAGTPVRSQFVYPAEALAVALALTLALALVLAPALAD